MSRRIVIEEPCEHGKFLRHRDTPDQFCPGGSRTVFEGIPEEWVERAAAVIASFDGYDVIDGRNGVAPWSTYQADAVKVLESVLGDGQ